MGWEMLWEMLLVLVWAKFREMLWAKFREMLWEMLLVWVKSSVTLEA